LNAGEHPERKETWRRNDECIGNPLLTGPISFIFGVSKRDVLKEKREARVFKSGTQFCFKN
jgi:hypothetical protein